MARRLEVEIVGDASSLKRALGQAETSSKNLGSKFGGLAKGAGLVAGAAGIGALIGTLKVGIGEFAEASKVTAQTNAVLKSTGGVANVSSKEISGLAGSILKKTGIDDEAIQSGENLLLTFTNIRNEAGKGNDIFNQTTGIMADLSTAMGIDTKSAAMQLGKALNDPATGMTKLARVGVTFTDGQKEAAKAMVAAGDTAGAQKIILKELTKEFGGSAEAAGKTLPGQLNILKESFSNVAGEIVGKMVPAVKAVVDFITKHWGTIETIIGGVFDGIGWAFTHVLLPVFKGIVTGAKAVVDWFVKNWGAISDQLGQTFGPFVKAGKAVFKLFDDLIHGRWGKLWEDFKSIVGSAASAIGGLFGKAIDGLHNLVDRILDATGLSALKDSTDDIFDGLKGQFRNVATAISAIIHGDWGKLKDAALGIVEGIAKQFYGLVKLIPQILGRAVPAIIGVYEDLGSKILDKLHLGFLTDGFRMYFDGLKDTLGGLFKILHGVFTGNFGEIFDGLKKMLLGALKQLAAPFVTAGHVIAAAATKFGQLIYDYVLAPIADLGKALGGALEDGVKAIGRAVTGAARTVAGFGERIAGWIGDAFMAAIDFGRWILGKIRDAAVTGASTVAGWADRIVGWLEAAFGRAADFGAWILGKIRDAAISGASTVAGWADRIVGWLKDAALRAIDFAAWILTRIGQAVISGLGTVKGWAETIVGWAKEAFLGAVHFGAWILEKIGDAAISGLGTVKGWATTIVEWLKEAFLGAVHFGAWILTRIGDAVISGLGTVKGWATTIGEWLKEAFLGALHFGAWILTKIGDAAISGLGIVKGWATLIGGWLETAFLGALHFGAWILTKIGDAVISGMGTVKDWATLIGSWFETAFKGVLHFGAWIADKIEAGYQAVKTALGNLKDKIVGWLRDLFDWFSPSGVFEELGQDMMRGLAKGILENHSPLDAIKLLFKLMGKTFPGMGWLEDVAGLGVGLARAVFGGAAQPGDVGISPEAWPREARVIAKANEIANAQIPYAVGGGHNSAFAPSRGAPHWGAAGSRIGYCCSGSVSAIMHAGDYLSYPMDSSGFYDWGQAGPGRFITTYAKPGLGGDGHVFAVLAGLGWGTGGNNDGGPGWYEHDRGSPYRARHPYGSQGPVSQFAASQTDAGGRALSGFREPGGHGAAAAFSTDTGPGGGSAAGTRGGSNVDGDGPTITAAMAAGFRGVMRLPSGGLLFGADGGAGDVVPAEAPAIGSVPAEAPYTIGPTTAAALEPAAPSPVQTFAANLGTPTFTDPGYAAWKAAQPQGIVNPAATYAEWKAAQGGGVVNPPATYAEWKAAQGGQATSPAVSLADYLEALKRAVGGGSDWVSRLPHYAAGTEFAPGGWSLVGEKGPELRFVPRGSRIVPNAQIPAAASSGAVTFEARLPVYLDGRQITEVVHRGLLNKKRENGTLGLG